ncbi:VOC family protein [Segnochrobactrum spirostomi]|uniref:Glyoxalase n=1 Tax=Segnochrobactrum spirostomi TaxID=2608987 RepID=A0A6A7XYX6_9HYPH|nr:VOC family protein [Segnochrobactrum spirostomi]MQT11703.1 glyoxalase [Segnochrobactrum spirostomi]
MIVRRIVPNIEVPDMGPAVVAAVRRFYCDGLGLEPVMDHGWIATFAGSGMASPQMSVACEGGNGTPVPALSIEVDDLDEAQRRIEGAGFAIEYGPTTEAWGVRRFFARDPLGRLINVLVHP